MATTTGSTNTFNSWVGYANQAANLGSDTFIFFLTTSSWTPNQATHSLLSDVTNELSGNGYSRQTATGVTFTQSGAVWTFDCNNPVFTASGGSLVHRYWGIFDDSIAGDPLVAYGLSDTTAGGTDVTTTAGNTHTVNVHASGLITHTRVS